MSKSVYMYGEVYCVAYTELAILYTRCIIYHALYTYTIYTILYYTYTIYLPYEFIG